MTIAIYSAIEMMVDIQKKVQHLKTISKLCLQPSNRKKVMH